MLLFYIPLTPIYNSAPPGHCYKTPKKSEKRDFFILFFYGKKPFKKELPKINNFFQIAVSITTNSETSKQSFFSSKQQMKKK